MKPYRIIGIESSPYAVKVRAVMRYRRLPHVWVARMPQFFDETKDLRPLLMPVVQFPDGAYWTDSTPIIRALEASHPRERTVRPFPPELAFLSDLIEDMADEWLTKSLFHYRFSNLTDRNVAAAWVMDDAHPGLTTAELAMKADAFVARQVARMPLVGCTADNGPLLEGFYRAVLDTLEPLVATDRFLFGTCPSLADFGLYGQLRTLSIDPTSGELMRICAPRTRHWIGRLDDGSGIEGRWGHLGQLAPAAEGLVSLAGRYYLPYLDANARALENGAEVVELELTGQGYSQMVNRYHAKCRSDLLRAFTALPDAARAKLKPLLQRTGSLEFLTG